MMSDITGVITFRAAREGDVGGIAALVNGYAAEAIMLYRSPESVCMTLHDFVVAVDPIGKVMACGALKEYSPSLAEVASVAVARGAHGLGLGTAIVTEVEKLARKRGVDELFALTLTPKFFQHAGYAIGDRSLYPEKIRRDCFRCPRRIRCNEYCVVRLLQEEIAVAA
ncbi:MAG: GNAT family N-acetyltransferase [Gemmatimonadota bacterium]|nr:GNAT family N-acetyltransferase [Gemmatimonadota bacterium]